MGTCVQIRREAGAVKAKPRLDEPVFAVFWGCRGAFRGGSIRGARVAPGRHPGERGYFTEVSSSLPGLKRATRFALIWMVSPVCGFRPVRALRFDGRAETSRA